MSAIVSDYMVKPALTIHEDAPLAEAVQKMLDSVDGLKILAVINHERELVGIVSASDLIREMARDIKLQPMRIVDVMTKRQRVVTVTPETSMIDAVEAMVRDRLRNLVVVSGWDCVGILNQNSILTWWRREIADDTGRRSV
ncbi:MAG: hypothetical protein OHK0023_23750 [Anaerolineae bacterium]